MMLTHGVAPEGLLLSTLVYVPKNKRGNECDSNSYRQIVVYLEHIKHYYFR